MNSSQSWHIHAAKTSGRKAARWQVNPQRQPGTREKRLPSMKN